RQANRSYDGAPPVITHSALGACITCHGAQRIQVPGLGVAPPHPHGETPGMAVARCEQCHVFQRTDEEFRGSTFRAWESDAGDRRAFEGAPPTMPHRTFGHEDCLSCHGSPTTPESLHCSHPERARCAQCHVEADTGAVFQR
ncbi:MAG: hypothetical protein O2816_11905, partial [Planctomycetota bacterium]|nr:hypothetical protein [Planctomycetota bacterium]